MKDIELKSEYEALLILSHIPELRGIGLSGLGSVR